MNEISKKKVLLIPSVTVWFLDIENKNLPHIPKQEFSYSCALPINVKQIFIIHNFIYRIGNYRHGLCSGDAGSTNYLKKCKQHGQN